jgi:hypothetical protein
MPGTGGDRATKGVLDGAAIKRGIDPSLSHSARGTRRVIYGEDRPPTRAHQRCSSSQSATHANQTSAMTASAVTNASATRRHGLAPP